jgi:hypothetical protein
MSYSQGGGSGDVAMSQADHGGGSSSSSGGGGGGSGSRPTTQRKGTKRARGGKGTSSAAASASGKSAATGGTHDSPADNRRIYSSYQTPCDGIRLRSHGGQNEDISAYGFLTVYLPVEAFRADRSFNTIGDLDRATSRGEALYCVAWLMAFINMMLSQDGFKTHVFIECCVRADFDETKIAEGANRSDWVGVRLRLASIGPKFSMEEYKALGGEPLCRKVREDPQYRLPEFYQPVGNVVRNYFLLLREAEQMCRGPLKGYQAMTTAFEAQPKPKRGAAKKSHFDNAQAAHVFLDRHTTVTSTKTLANHFNKINPKPFQTAADDDDDEEDGDNEGDEKEGGGGAAGSSTAAVRQIEDEHKRDMSAIDGDFFGQYITFKLSLKAAMAANMHRKQRQYTQKAFGIPELVYKIPSHEFMPDNFDKFLFPMLTGQTLSEDAMLRTLQHWQHATPAEMYAKVQTWLRVCKANKYTLDEPIIKITFDVLRILDHEVSTIFANYSLGDADQYYDDEGHDDLMASSEVEPGSALERHFAELKTNRHLLFRLFLAAVMLTEGVDASARQQRSAHDLEAQDSDLFDEFADMRDEIEKSNAAERAALAFDKLRARRVSLEKMRECGPNGFFDLLDDDERKNVVDTTERSRRKKLQVTTVNACNRSFSNMFWADNRGQALRSVTSWFERRQAAGVSRDILDKYPETRNVLSIPNDMFFPNLDIFGSDMTRTVYLMEMANEPVSHVPILDSFISHNTASEQGYGRVDPYMKSNTHRHGPPGVGKTYETNRCNSTMMIRGTYMTLDGTTAKSLLPSITSKNKIDNSINQMVLQCDDLSVDRFEVRGKVDHDKGRNHNGKGGGESPSPANVVGEDGDVRYRSGVTDSKVMEVTEQMAMLNRMMTGTQTHGGGRLQEKDGEFQRNEGIHNTRVCINFNGNWAFPPTSAFANRVRQKLARQLDRQGNNPQDRNVRAAEQNDHVSGFQRLLTLSAQSRQFGCFWINHHITSGAIQPVDASKAQALLSLIFQKAGLLMDSAEVSVNRSMDRMAGVAHVCTLMEALAKTYDHPLFSPVMNKQFNAAQMRIIESELFMRPSYLVFAISMFAQSHFHPKTQLIVEMLRKIKDAAVEKMKKDKVNELEKHPLIGDKVDYCRYKFSVAGPNASSSSATPGPEQLLTHAAEFLARYIAEHKQNLRVDISDIRECLSRIMSIKYRVDSLRDDRAFRFIQGIQLRNDPQHNDRVMMVVACELLEMHGNPIEVATEEIIGQVIEQDQTFVTCSSSSYLPYILKTKVIRRRTAHTLVIEPRAPPRTTKNLPPAARGVLDEEDPMNMDDVDIDMSPPVAQDKEEKKEEEKKPLPPVTKVVWQFANDSEKDMKAKIAAAVGDGRLKEHRIGLRLANHAYVKPTLTHLATTLPVSQSHVTAASAAPYLVIVNNLEKLCIANRIMTCGLTEEELKESRPMTTKQSLDAMRAAAVIHRWRARDKSKDDEMTEEEMARRYEEYKQAREIGKQFFSPAMRQRLEDEDDEFGNGKECWSGADYPKQLLVKNPKKKKLTPNEKMLLQRAELDAADGIFTVVENYVPRDKEIDDDDEEKKQTETVVDDELLDQVLQGQMHGLLGSDNKSAASLFAHTRRMIQSVDVDALAERKKHAGSTVELPDRAQLTRILHELTTTDLSRIRATFGRETAEGDSADELDLKHVEAPENDGPLLKNKRQKTTPGGRSSVDASNVKTEAAAASAQVQQDDEMTDVAEDALMMRYGGDE